MEGNKGRERPKRSRDEVRELLMKTGESERKGMVLIRDREA